MQHCWMPVPFPCRPHCITSKTLYFVPSGGWPTFTFCFPLMNLRRRRLTSSVIFGWAERMVAAPGLLNSHSCSSLVANLLLIPFGCSPIGKTITDARHRHRSRPTLRKTPMEDGALTGWTSETKTRGRSTRRLRIADAPRALFCPQCAHWRNRCCASGWNDCREECARGERSSRHA